MAKVLSPEAVAEEAEKKRLKEERDKLKKERKAQKKEARRRASEIAKEEEAFDEGGNGLVTVGATVLIIFLWLAVICVIVKLDIGGFGSTVLTPLLKDVPVINKILPGFHVTETTDPEGYGGYASLQDAVEYIKQLEKELERAQNASNTKDADIGALKAENERLREFESKQLEFMRIKNEFYEEVIYSDKGPGMDVYKKWYETMDPTTADFLYKQVVQQMQESEEVQKYARAYAEMKPKEAAAIFEEMENELNLVAKILNAMSAEDRGKILGAMNAKVAAKLTKIMNPDS